MKVIFKNSSILFKTLAEPGNVSLDNYVNGYYTGSVGEETVKHYVSSGYYCLDNAIEIISLETPIILRVDNETTPSRFGYNFWYLDSSGKLLSDPQALDANDMTKARSTDGFEITIPANTKYIKVSWRASGEPFASSWLKGDIAISL